MSAAECPFTTCHGHIVITGREVGTDERVGLCDTCGEALRERQGKWMSRDSPYLPG